MRGAASALVALVAACGHFDFERTSDAGTRARDAADDATADAPDAPPGPLAVGLILHFDFASSSLAYESVSGTEGDFTEPPIRTLDPNLSAATFLNEACIRFPAEGLNTGAMTFAAWTRFEVAQNATVFGRTLRPDTSNNAFTIFFESDPPEALVEVSDVALTAPAFPDEWHHIAGVFDGVTLSMYVDGDLIDSTGANVPGYPTGIEDVITVGCDFDLGMEAFFFNGDIADVRLYNRPLTPSELGQLVELGR